MHPVAAYLRDVSEIRRSGAGAPELSYYPALSALLNAVGHELRPRVRCVMNLRNRGAGLPDGGLFTPDQFGRGADPEFGPDLAPARGVLEVKAASARVEQVAAGEQVERYFTQYRQVLVCNLWDFLLVGRDGTGAKAHLERFRLAGSEAEFWEKAAHHQATAKESGDSLLEYLKRVMLQAASLGDPREVAWLLASYAREAKFRVEAKGDLPKLAAVRAGLGEALGVSFAGEKGEHFFRSTLVQTLFYGLFASWVMWAREAGRQDRYSRFNWKEASWTLHVPMMRALFTQVASPDQLEPLGLVEVLDWTAQALNRVDRAEFFTRFVEEHAVQYFYEPFLQAFDPDLRKDLGVWYTPPEIVAYMVERVDRVLREELDIPDGLADPRVHVLDPCCGTGAYLVEVLRRIHRTRLEQGGDALAAQDVKRAAMQRVFGFELLPAPYVVAHMQLGLLLTALGASFRLEPAERAGVYLTNALTGWDPPEGPKQQLLFPELEEERDLAERVKREAPILVVLGNPPYNAFAGVSPEEEKGLVEPYKEGLARDWKIKKFNLDDLYVRFFRLAERRIAEMGERRGVVCYISNCSWVTEPSFVVLRRHLLHAFDALWIENMHGNRKISEYAPDGRTSETVFAIPGFSAGIQQGVAISLWLKKGPTGGPASIYYRDDINAAKAVDRREQLLATLDEDDPTAQYIQATPATGNRYCFRPARVTDEYLDWPKLTDLCAVSPNNGLMEKRGGALVDIDREALEGRMRRYFDPAVTWEELRGFGTGLTKDAARFDAKRTRERFLATEQYQSDNLLPYAMRPFDVQYAYYSGVRPLWNEPRPTLWKQCWPGNAFLLSRVATTKRPEGAPMSFSRGLFDDHLLSPDASGFPMQVLDAPAGNSDQHLLLGGSTSNMVANLSMAARAYSSELGFSREETEGTPDLVWMHALAIGFSVTDHSGPSCARHSALSDRSGPI